MVNGSCTDVGVRINGGAHHSICHLWGGRSQHIGGALSRFCLGSCTLFMAAADPWERQHIAFL